jgi:hypothetical protein
VFCGKKALARSTALRVDMTFFEFGIEENEQKQRPKQKQIPAG